MLSFRLEELNDSVDYFIIIEGHKTFVGKDKDSYFLLNKSKFDKYNHKIIHHIVNDMNFENPWYNEKKQRDGIGEILNTLDIEDNDLIILSDCDEIPDVKTLKNIKSNGLNEIMTLSQDFYYYNLNLRFDGKWGKSKIGNWYSVKKHQSTDSIRYQDLPSIENGGWHFSYFGDENFISNKIENFSHQEYNLDDYKSQNHIRNCIETRKSLFNENVLNYIDLEKNNYLPKNYELLIT
jgi:beta-1,4-mannosyl-glycoprotein beta-1,4-N-acetylglucosaminyltransferase